MAAPKVHACNEVRAGVQAFTFCSLVLTTGQPRGTGTTRAGRPIRFVTEDIRLVTCRRCARAAA